MLRAVLAAILCVAAVSAAAQNLRGQWQGARGQTLTDAILIDSERRITWDEIGGKKPLKLLGYVARTTPEVEMVLTNRDNVLRIQCTLHSPDLLHCNAAWRGKPPAEAFVLTRVGPGPQRIMPASR